MSTAVPGSVLAGLAVGDFRDRVRRPVYAVTLLAAVGLGYLAVPNADGHWTIMDVGGSRGVYNSAYVGAVTALAGALWLTFGGFYVVRSGIARDETTGVGQVLAATPLRTSHYLLAKFLSNLLVLASMVGVLAVTALLMQLARGEDRAVDPVALAEPFLLLSLPVMAVTAAAALLFETVPLLRGGFGNVVWFVLAMVLAIGGQSASAPLDGLGVHQVARSMGAALEAQQRTTDPGGFSLGLTKVDKPLGTFHWDGFDPASGFLLGRLALFLAAFAVALLPALWFGRFDPARGSGDAAPVPAAAGAAGEPSVLDGAEPEGARWATAQGVLPRTEPRRAGAFGRLLAGEARILVQGVSRWWWLVAAGLTVAGFALPMDAVTGLLLPLTWLWPVLIWSRLGSQRVENGLEVLLGAYPSARRRLLAEWASGLVLTAVTGVAPLIRMLVAGDAAGAASWLGGALFVPSLAMALGVVSRSHRLFQAVYLPLWWILVNNVAAVDFMGAVRVNGSPAGPGPLLVGALSAAMLAVVFLVGAARRNVKG
ncbi:ABC transporter permease [Kitasatospora sp. NPDC057542]|uniref:ABC transporter permease n=1 Tax=Streptomycetaceae TaxID=2062 RepID=UPI001CC91D6E|nr:ABC transporter permease [Streptomyces sp. LS1784]